MQKFSKDLPLILKQNKTISKLQKQKLTKSMYIAICKTSAKLIRLARDRVTTARMEMQYFELLKRRSNIRPVCVSSLKMYFQSFRKINISL